MATTSEASMAMTIVMPSWENSCPDNPSIVLSGR